MYYLCRPEEKIKQLEKKVNELIEESCFANSRGEFSVVSVKQIAPLLKVLGTSYFRPVVSAILMIRSHEFWLLQRFIVIPTIVIPTCIQHLYTRITPCPF